MLGCMPVRLLVEVLDEAPDGIGKVSTGKGDKLGHMTTRSGWESAHISLLALWTWPS